MESARNGGGSAEARAGFGADAIARAAEAWEPPEEWSRIRTVDAHAAGEPLRVVVEGAPEIPGATMGERRRWAEAHLDGLRRTLVWEPRGHADMYGCLLTPPATEDGDFGLLFLHNEGFSTMCGHGIVGVATVVLETGILPARPPETRLRIDTPAGRVTARAEVEGPRTPATDDGARDEGGRVGGRNASVDAGGVPTGSVHVGRVAFRNVPSFALGLDREVEVPALGRVCFDLAFGGAFYAYVDAGEAGVELAPRAVPDLVRAGRAIKTAVAEASAVEHPEDPDLGFLYGTIFTAPSEGPGVHSRHVCVFADGEVDRSPTGTGVSGRLAILHARGEVEPERRLVFESLVGTRFGGRVVGRARVGDREAVIPEVEGRAWVTGRHEFLVDPSDPLREGVLLR